MYAVWTRRWPLLLLTWQSRRGGRDSCAAARPACPPHRSSQWRTRKSRQPRSRRRRWARRLAGWGARPPPSCTSGPRCPRGPAQRGRSPWSPLCTAYTPPAWPEPVERSPWYSRATSDPWASSTRRYCTNQELHLNTTDNLKSEYTVIHYYYTLRKYADNK